MWARAPPLPSIPCRNLQVFVASPPRIADFPDSDQFCSILDESR